MTQQMYIQCKLMKGILAHVAWIKKELAVEGQYAAFKDEDGVWLIKEAYSNVELPWDEINERGQDFKHTREVTSKGMKTFLVWGEYGPLADQAVKVKLRAFTEQAALKRGLQYMKGLAFWHEIGEHNVHVKEIPHEKPSHMGMM